MAIKKPLCLYSGLLQEIQSGDTIQGATGEVTLSGTETLVNKTFTDYAETFYDATFSNPLNISAANGNIQQVTLTGTCTLNLPVLPVGKSMTIILKGNYVPTFAAGSGQTLRWNNGVAPGRTVSSTKYDIYVFLANTSSTVLGFDGGRNF